MFQRIFFPPCLKYTEGKGIFLVLIVYYWILTATRWGVDMIDTEAWRGAETSESTQRVGQSPDLNPADTRCKAQAFHVEDLHVEVP